MVEPQSMSLETEDTFYRYSLVTRASLYTLAEGIGGEKTCHHDTPYSAEFRKSAVTRKLFEVPPLVR